MQIRNRLDAFVPDRDIEFGPKMIPIASFTLMKEMALSKPDDKVPWALGRQMLIFFYSGRSASIFMNYMTDASLKSELKATRRAINDFVKRVTGISVTIQLEDYCHQQRKYFKQKLDRKAGNHVCKVCERKCKDRRDRVCHEEKCTKASPHKTNSNCSEDSRASISIGRLRRSTRLKPDTKSEKLYSKIRTMYQRGLEVRITEIKRRGIYALRKFQPDDYVCVYGGNLLSADEGYINEEKYKARRLGSYLFFFNHKGTKHCIDATEESANYGRLINHSRKKRNINIKPRVMIVNNRLHVVFFATKEIPRCAELLYDYGENRKFVVDDMPWLKE